MPFSAEGGKDFIKEVVKRLPHQSMLDIGPGCGTYAKLFPEIADKTAVEIWGDYIEKYNLKSLYNHVIRDDARDYTPTRTYDIVLLGDVLEHMTFPQAKLLFWKMMQVSKTVIVSVPLGEYPQGAYEGNPYEEHIETWTHQHVLSMLGLPKWYEIEDGIGVYVFTQEQWKPKIAVYAIMKGEKQFVERFCNGAKEADLIVIADTGSTDGADEEARRCGAVVHDLRVRPWRFDIARNAALALLPDDVDICVSLDIDEVLQPGWREEIERVWQPNTTRLKYMFDWGAGIAFWYEKIHARWGYRWHHPVHEYPVPYGIKEKWAWTRPDFLMVIHQPDPTKSRGQYMPLLEMAVAEDPRCPRNRFYHARELTFYRRWDDAIDALNSYLMMPEATWRNERCYAMRLLGDAYMAKGQLDEAERWYIRACAEAPDTREPWVGAANIAEKRRKWDQCWLFAMRALSITNKEAVYTMDPEVWTWKPHDHAALAAFNMGDKENAVRHGKLAVEGAPHMQRLRVNLSFYEKMGN